VDAGFETMSENMQQTLFERQNVADVAALEADYDWS
jgi:hypothetical protein